MFDGQREEQRSLGTEKEREGWEPRQFSSLCMAPALSPRSFLPNSPAYPQAWAIYKGKHLEGIDKEDPSTWKTRLRCALNKSADFCEVRERSQLDISNPYKVYRLLSDGAHDPGTILPAGGRSLEWLSRQ